jgi:hypothetical protein
MNNQRVKWPAALIVSTLAFASIAEASPPAVTQSIEPAKIDLGEAARLTIAASGSDAPAITPPMVAGLEFVAVGQSQRIESVNGLTNSTTSVTYQVIPRAAGVYTIPGAAPGSQPVVLTVNPGSGGNSIARGSARATAPQVAPGMLPAGQTHLNADGSAFVRLRLAKHELYVGETIPVDIEVGMRDGFVASLNGLPTLNGDEFTLNKLSSEPQRTEEIIDGKSFTVLTWHSALAAVKPGTLSMTVETPLTVRMHTRSRPDAGPFGDAGLDDLFNDPAFQNFFGTSTEKEITVASKPADFTVLALPTRDQPADFSGAIGHFTVSSDLSADKAAAGDPVTLRLRVSGTGNFDRVTSLMLHDVAHWKTYSPTATFKAEDGIGSRGEKTFEQPIMAAQPGTQSVPTLTFSWFDPSTRRYSEAHTSPLTVAITPASTDSAVARLTPTPTAVASAPPASESPANALRPDHVDNRRGVASLRPHYVQPVYMAIPSFLMVAFSGAWFWVRRRERSAAESDSAAAKNSLQTEALINVMAGARAASDTELFFKSARAALQRALASKWHLTPDSISIEDVVARLGEGSDVARLFTLADEIAYSGMKLTAIDFRRWTRIVLRITKGNATS